MAYKTPDTAELVSMMDMMLGAETKAAVADSVDDSSHSHTAEYVNSAGECVATCRCTLPTAAALGCALSMIPPGGAEGMVEDKALTKMATENLYEVMNIFSSLMMSDKSSHLKLTVVNESNDSALGGEAFAFTIDLGKYGPGYLLFNVA